MINVGVIISSLNLRGGSPREQMEEAMWLTIKHALNNNEKILMFKHIPNTRSFNVITNKARYTGYFMSDSIRGYRWSKTLVYGEITKDQIEQIHCCIRPTDINNESWNVEEQVFKLH